MDYRIKNDAWAKIFEFLSSIHGLHTKDETKIRRFIEAIWLIVRGGMQWRLLPEEYGKWNSIHRRFSRWVKAGIWEQIMTYVTDADLENVMLDSTIVRANACAAGLYKNSQAQEALGRSAGGFSTKIHALVDSLGNPLKFILTPGQHHDVTVAENLLINVENSCVIADKGYISKSLTNTIAKQGCKAVIPSRCNSLSPNKIDKHLYKERHLVECFFSKIKYFRRIFSRYDKSAASFLGYLHFVGALIWLR